MTTLNQLNKFYGSKGLTVHVEKTGKNSYTAFDKTWNPKSNHENQNRRMMIDLKDQLNGKTYRTNKEGGFKFV